MLYTSFGLILVLRVLHRREAYRQSTRISQDAPEKGGADADEIAESDGAAAAAESRLL